MGTPDFAATALQALIDSPHNVVAVYSQPPRPKGRGQQVQKSPVHELADEHGIPVRTPANFKNEADVKQFQDLNLDVAVVAAYGLILPKAILDAPRHGCINIHGSLLPRWRGAAPIQHAIWAGDDKTGITIMQMNEGLDTGPMIMAEATPITMKTTAQTLHDELADMGARLILKTLDILAKDNKICASPQNDDASSYASMLKKDDGKIDFTQGAEEIDRQIRALNPWPGTFCTVDGKRLKIHTASVSSEKTQSQPGTILDKSANIACGDGTVLRLEIVQPENKKPMDIASAFNGGYLNQGDVLS